MSTQHMHNFWHAAQNELALLLKITNHLKLRYGRTYGGRICRPTTARCASFLAIQLSSARRIPSLRRIKWLQWIKQPCRVWWRWNCEQIHRNSQGDLRLRNLLSAPNICEWSVGRHSLFVARQRTCHRRLWCSRFRNAWMPVQNTLRIVVPCTVWQVRESTWLRW